MKNNERIYKNKALTKAWDDMDMFKTWWFDTSDEYPKHYSLDKQGVPICWDDITYPVQETIDCTGDDICTIILSNKDQIAILVVNKDLENVMVQGSVTASITWDKYNTKGLLAVREQCPGYKLEAVIINPRIKTLEKFNVVKSIIKKIIEARDFTEGDKNEPANQEDSVHQGEASEEQTE